MLMSGKGWSERSLFYEGRMGPDAGSGLRTGGGILWQKAPRDMRALPQWREIWTEISLLEGRLLPRCPLQLIPAAEAVLMINLRALAGTRTLMSLTMG